MNIANTIFCFVLFYSMTLSRSHSDNKSEIKRILVSDQIDSQQFYHDFQNLKATVEQMKQRLETQEQMIQASQGAVYIQWGRKNCTKSGTNLVYSGIASGGRYNEIGRSAIPLCAPHDPDIGPVLTTAVFGTIYGMEYFDNAKVYGESLHEKDVPCAVCKVQNAATVLMIPGKKRCQSRWNLEYDGILTSGHFTDAGASSYICIDRKADALEGGARNDEGYNIFPVKAFCGSLKCPPYGQNTLVYCAVCSQ